MGRTKLKISSRSTRIILGASLRIEPNRWLSDRKSPDELSLRGVSAASSRTPSPWPLSGGQDRAWFAAQNFTRTL